MESSGRKTGAEIIRDNENRRIAMSDYLRPLAADATGEGKRFGKITGGGNFTITSLITGGPTSAAVDIKGGASMTGHEAEGILASHTFTSAEIAAGVAVFHISGKPSDYVLYDITDLTGGTSPTITFIITQ